MFVKIPGYTRYSVNDQGVVVSNVKGNPLMLKQTIRNSAKENRSYLCVGLYDGTSWQPKVVAVHQLVMLAFVGPAPQGKIVNHKDTNKLNNTLSNLEYCTYGENSRHAVKAGVIKSSTQAHRSKLNRDQVLSILELKGTMSSVAAAEVAKTCQPTVHAIWSGKIYQDITIPWIQNNPREAVLDGRGRSVLTEDMKYRLISLKGKVRLYEAAKEFGISSTTVKYWWNKT